MDNRQVIWLQPGVTTFRGLCDQCLERPKEPAPVPAYRGAKVSGTLRADADVGFTRCARGHPISVRRLGRSAA
jgi:hypothetical protein